MTLRGDVYLIALDPTLGHKIAKMRPGVVLSPDEMNRALGAVIVGPLTSRGKPYPTRVPCRFHNRSGLIALDQIRAVDKTRLVRRLGKLPEATMESALALLREMFER